MIIAHATAEGDIEPLVILGLERGNIDLLKQGRPMTITQESHPGFPLKCRIVVVYADTPADLVKLIQPFMDANTKIIDNRQKPGRA